MKQKILIVGSGGREHALAWHVARYSDVSQVFVAPGNAGTQLEKKVTNISIDPCEVEKLRDFALEQKINLTIVGPEAPLVIGIKDCFDEAELNCFGPSKLAAQLEGSKKFSKDFMSRHKIPTASYKSFTNAKEAKKHLETINTPIVIKADGLAAGKGVFITNTKEEASRVIDNMLQKKQFKEAGQCIIIEEFLQGEEASFMVIADGEQALPLASSKDHKKLYEKDQGPNTGGMGAYSPSPIIDQQKQKEILEAIVKPTLVGLKQEGYPYSGFLYVGLMITKDGEPKVLEYNCRLGDPEAQVILLRLKTPLHFLCYKALEHRLHKINEIEWDSCSSLGVVLTSKDYPATSQTGDQIEGLSVKKNDKIKIFHAATKVENDHIVTNGGRVLCVCGLGDDISLAKKNVYDQIKHIHWDGMYFRKDIG